MSCSPKSIFSSFISDTFFTYETVKVVKIPHTFTGIFYRCIQLIIVTYIAVYIVWYKKGYQQIQEPRGTSVIKVKGVATVRSNDTRNNLYSSLDNIWDTAEYQLPPLENNALFIVTRQIVTFNQTLGSCPSAIDDKLFCNSTTASTICPKDVAIPNTFGYFTGNCVQSRQNPLLSVCEIKAWCPEELEKSVEYSVNSDELENFTIYIKTIVTFTLFDINLRNVRDDTDFSCRFNKNTSPRCPIFRIGDILNSLNTNKTALFYEGGLIEIRQEWNCNFDYRREKCFPSIDFRLLQSGDDKQSPGVNYRSAERYRVNDQTYRTLSKIHGLRFVVSISGKGGQFDIVNLFFAIGSGIGFMVIATIITEIVLEYFHKYRNRYSEGKYLFWQINAKELFTNMKAERTVSYDKQSGITTINDYYDNKSTQF